MSEKHLLPRKGIATHTSNVTFTARAPEAALRSYPTVMKKPGMPMAASEMSTEPGSTFTSNVFVIDGRATIATWMNVAVIAMLAGEAHGSRSSANVAENLPFSPMPRSMG